MATNFTIEPAVFTAIASNVNDMTSGGVWTSTSNANALITVRISASRAKDTVTNDHFVWSMNGGIFSNPPTEITAATPIPVVHGLTVTFATATGHGVGDIWTILVTAAPLALGQVLRQRGFGGKGVTLQDFMEETIHVNRFGAKGDGVTDDTVAIQNAINYAQLFTPGAPGGAPNGGKVHLGRGTYVISKTITIPRGVQLLGETAFATVILAGANFPSSAWNSFMVVIGVIYPTPGQNTFATGIADLSLDCGDPGYGYTPAAHISCLSIGDPVNGGINELTYIERLHLGNYTDYGIAGTIVFQLENCRFGDLWITARSGATQCKGVFLFGSTSRVHMYSVTVAGVYGYTSIYPAVTLVGCQGVQISHFHPEWCAIGILMQACGYIGIENFYGNPSVPTDVQIDNNPNTDFPPWSSTTGYLMGDTVSYSGVKYLCILNNTNNTPGGSNNSYWFKYGVSGGIQVRTVLSAGGTYALLDYRQSSINPHSLAWDPTLSYARLEQVLYSGLYYVSLSVDPNLNNQPDVSPTWWIPGTPVFNVLDTYLDSSCFTQVMGFKNNTGFGFDTFEEYPGATIEVKGAVLSLTGPDANCGIRLQRPVDGVGYSGIGFPALSTSGRKEMALLIEPGTDDLILGNYHTGTDPAAIALRIQNGGDVILDVGSLRIRNGSFYMGPGLGTVVIDSSRNLAVANATSEGYLSAQGAGANGGLQIGTVLSIDGNNNANFASLTVNGVPIGGGGPAGGDLGGTYPDPIVKKASGNFVAAGNLSAQNISTGTDGTTGNITTAVLSAQGAGAGGGLQVGATRSIDGSNNAHFASLALDTALPTTSGGTGQYFADQVALAQTLAHPKNQSNVTAARAIGTVYQNTTGFPVFVNITMSGAASTYTAASGFAASTNPPSSVDGQVAILGWSAAQPEGLYQSMSFYVLPGDFYQVIVHWGSAAIARWVETY